MPPCSPFAFRAPFTRLCRPGSHRSFDQHRSIVGRGPRNIEAMTAPIDIYYDFRSPYAYLAWWRIRRQQALPLWRWRWKPVSIDVLLNLQAGRGPLAPYVDPLPPPKRKHFLADVRRSANFLGAPLSPPHQPRPDPAPALCVALRLAQDGIPHDRFIDMVFEAMWQHRSDIGTREVLTNCLISAALGEALTEFCGLAGDTKRVGRTIHAGVRDGYLRRAEFCGAWRDFLWGRPSGHAGVATGTATQPIE